MSTVYIRFTAHSSDALQRSPLIERLLLRASRAVSIDDWRADAFGLIVPAGTMMPTIATAAMMVTPTDVLPAEAAPMSMPVDDGIAVQAEGAGANRETLAVTWACVATPVHLTAGMSSVAMPQEGVLTLARDDARALAGEFNRVFVDAGVRLKAVPAGTLLCLFDRPMDVATHDPERVAGHDVFGFQPTGADARRLRQLMSEMEMWLFDHDVNRGRAARGEPAVTGLWLWGGGAIGEPPAVSIWAAGRDSLFAAFGDEPAIPSDGRSGVVVCGDQPGSATWPAVEQRWLMTAVDAWRAGRIRRVYLSAARRRFALAAGPRWRFWRRPRPWWESFELTSAGSGEA